MPATLKSANSVGASVKSLISRADLNHDGRVSSVERARALAKVSGTSRTVLNAALRWTPTAKAARTAVDRATVQIKAADRNRDGFISTTERNRLNAFAKLLVPNASAQVVGSGAVHNTHVSGHQIGGYGPLRPPAEVAHYGNGKIPTSRLTSIGINGHKLYAPAAAAFNRMRSAAAAQGVKIGVTDSYRSFAQQVDLAKRKGLYQNGGLAATPGKSNHGWGLALDLDVKSNGLAWLRKNAYKFGFAEAVPREPWHWEYRPGQARS